LDLLIFFDFQKIFRRAINLLVTVIDLLGWLNLVVQIKFQDFSRELITIFIESFSLIKIFIWFFFLMMFAIACVLVNIEKILNNYKNLIQPI